MHVVQYLLVAATNPKGALESAHAVAADADWSDWYDIGGRWEGDVVAQFPDLKDRLANNNVLPISEFPHEARLITQASRKRQNNAFLESRDALAGNAVAEADIPGHIFGLPVADSAEAARRATASNAAIAQEWRKVLTSTSLDDLEASFLMSLYHAQRLARIVDGVWGPDSAFYDSVNHTARTRYLLDYLNGDSTDAFDPDINHYLVVVDFHY